MYILHLSLYNNIYTINRCYLKIKERLKQKEENISYLHICIYTLNEVKKAIPYILKCNFWFIDVA